MAEPGLLSARQHPLLTPVITDSVSKSLSNNDSKCILKQPFKSARMPLPLEAFARGSVLG